MLTHTDLSLSEIAYAVGFSDQSHMRGTSVGSNTNLPRLVTINRNSDCFCPLSGYVSQVTLARNRTTTSADLSVSTSNVRSRENAPSAGQRHPQPIRPMRELVFNFIKRFLQQEKIEKTIGVLGGLRPKPLVVQ